MVVMVVKQWIRHRRHRHNNPRNAIKLDIGNRMWNVNLLGWYITIFLLTAVNSSRVAAGEQSSDCFSFISAALIVVCKQHIYNEHPACVHVCDICSCCWCGIEMDWNNFDDDTINSVYFHVFPFFIPYYLDCRYPLSHPVTPPSLSLSLPKSPLDYIRKQVAW